MESEFSEDNQYANENSELSDDSFDVEECSNESLSEANANEQIHLELEWVKVSQDTSMMDIDNIFDLQNLGVQNISKELTQPIQFFLLIFNNSMIELIRTYTNKNGNRKDLVLIRTFSFYTSHFVLFISNIPCKFYLLFK